VRVYPDLVFGAEQNGVSASAFRVWLLAKDFCKGGATVPVRLFKDHLEGLGEKKATYNRWIREALDLGLLKGEGGNKRPAYYRIVSWVDGARLAGVSRLGCPIEMPVKKLLTSSWKSELWAGRLLQVRDRTTVTPRIYKDQNGETRLEKKLKRAKPISRRTLEKITGVKRRTQQNREKRAKVQQKENVLIHEGKRGGFQPYGSIEGRPELMVNSGGVPFEQLPNSRVIPGHIKRTNSRSRTRKINSGLKALGLCGSIAQVKADISLRYIDTLREGKAILERYPDVAILQYSGRVVSGVMGWKVFSYGL